MGEKSPPAETPRGMLVISILAVVVGIIAAGGAIVFRGLIAFFHNLLFLGQVSFFYNADLHTPPSPWGPFIMLVPVIGAAGTVFLITRFASEAKGRGVPELMDAIYYKAGIIRPIVAPVKAIASALDIGSGAPVGREGPIIQIGGSLASLLSRALKTSVRERLTLIAAGAAGGISATFNTPIGGILFVVELMLFEISAETLVPVTLAAVTATFLSRLVFGPNPSFVIPALNTSFETTVPAVLLLYALLGVILGVVAAIYIRGVFAWEDLLEKKLRLNYYVRHMGAMAIVGLVMYLMITFTGYYYIQGVGYATIQDILDGTLTVIWFMLLLFVLKLFLTTMVLGSGASGGIFSPGLFLGATLGGAFGTGMSMLFPWMGISTVAFTVAGMGAVVGGATGAAIAAIVMMFEMTRDYSIIVPLSITVAVAYGVRKVISRESLYTLGLKRRGHPIPASLEAYFPEAKEVQAVMDIRFFMVPSSGTFQETRFPEDTPLLVTDRDMVTGIITRDRVRANAGSTAVFGNKAEKVIFVAEGTQLSDVVTQLPVHSARAAIVVRAEGERHPDAVIGIITADEIDAILSEESDLFEPKDGKKR
jgi:CIC family chloride channel protein